MSGSDRAIAAIDQRLLATVDAAFAKHAGADARIDAAELQKALGIRSEYLTRRVLAAFDRDADGTIDKDEFREGVRKLVFGSGPRQAPLRLSRA